MQLVEKHAIKKTDPRFELIDRAAKRTRRIDHFMQTASKHIIDLLVAERIGTLVIGKNSCWKKDRRSPPNPKV